jgi:hypothetical protein
MPFFTHPFLATGLIAVLAILALMGRWLWARHILPQHAREDYAVRRADRPRSIEGVEEEEFVALYTAAHEPRWALYTAAALTICALLTPIALLALNAGWVWRRDLTDADVLFDVGHLPWMFFMFFGIIGVWALVTGVAARLHHLRRPEGFQAALRRARGEPLDDVDLPDRPNWARRAVPDITTAEPEEVEDEPLGLATRYESGAFEIDLRLEAEARRLRLADPATLGPLLDELHAAVAALLKQTEDVGVDLPDDAGRHRLNFEFALEKRAVRVVHLHTEQAEDGEAGALEPTGSAQMRTRAAARILLLDLAAVIFEADEAGDLPESAGLEARRATFDALKTVLEAG